MEVGATVQDACAFVDRVVPTGEPDLYNMRGAVYVARLLRLREVDAMIVALCNMRARRATEERPLGSLLGFDPEEVDQVAYEDDHLTQRR